MSCSLEEEEDGAGPAPTAGDVLELDTSRSGVDELLESMFTERTAENGDEENELELPEETDGDESPTDPIGSDTHRGSDDVGTDEQQKNPGEAYGGVGRQQETDVNAAATTRTSIDSTEHRAHEAIDPSPPERSALRVIAFDVGGKLFRCKQSLIRKYPRKRLNQVISCGCERLDHDTFFIDRNPQNFEVILDWYRTGMYVRHPHVDENALQEDAKYFDLYAELFPEKILPALGVDRSAGAPTLVPRTDPGDVAQQQQPPRVPPRPHRHQRQPSSESASGKFSDSTTTDSVVVTNSQHSMTHPSSTRFSACHESTDATTNGSAAGAFRFCRTEHRSVVADGIPVVYMVRENEKLQVASVAGHGKLLVRVCDSTGMQVVLVETAVLFDSQSWFYLQGGRAKLDRCLLPGNHTYTFWMEPSNRSASNSTDTLKSKYSDALKVSSHSKNENHELEVEFKIVSNFRVDEQCSDALDEKLRSLVDSNSVANVFLGSATLSSRECASLTTFSPFLFLPPRLHKQLQQQHETEGQPSDQQVEAASSSHDRKLSSPRVISSKRPDFDLTKQLKNRDAVATQLFSHPSSNQNKTAFAIPPPTSTVDKTAKKTKGASDIQNSVIKRGGTAVVSGSPSANISPNTKNNNNSSKVDVSGATQAGRITVYRAADLKLEDSPREPLRSTHRGTFDKTHDTTPSRIASKHREHQPRLLR